MINEDSEVFEAKITERNERAKKLYRYISDVARRVGDETAASRSIADLFTTQLEIQRQKLRDNSEKLFFLDPTNFGKKTLELIWRKIYYEPISSAKKFRETDTNHDSCLFTHIVCGIGHFHQIITQIQSELNLHVKELDYMIIHDDEESWDKSKKTDDEHLQFGKSALHVCLIYLGDLSRYQAEIFHSFDKSIAARYYLQAAQLDMSSGMPYNQLGNLYMDINYNLDSVCYYIHCLSCDSPFDGALGNLTKIFEKNSQLEEALHNSESMTQAEHIQMMVINFFSLIEIWYFNKNDTDIPKRCSTIAQEFKIALDFHGVPLPDINKNYDDYTQAVEEENTNPTYLNNNLVHKMVLICLFTINKVAEIDETKVFAVKAFTLAILSQLVQKLLAHLESMGLQNPAHKLHPNRYHVEIDNSNTEKKENLKELIDDPQDDCVETKVSGKHESGDELLMDEEFDDNDSIKENGDTKNNSKKVIAKRRRRRRAASIENSDSDDGDSGTDQESIQEDCSDQEQESDFYSEDDSKSESSVDISDSEEMRKETNGEVPDNNEVDKNIKVNGLSNGTMKPQELTDDKDNWKEHSIQDFLAGNNYLASMKLLQDWILLEKDLILSCGDSGESMFQCVVDLLNIFMFYFHSNNNNPMKSFSKILDYATKVAKSMQLEYKTIPLPEDINLRGTNICKYDKDAAEWQILDKYKPNIYEENIIRVLDFIDFGNQIAKVVPQIRYNRTLKIFYLKKTSPPKLITKLNTKKNREWHNSKKQHGDNGQSGLLRRLGRLWLASRVKELEKTAGGGCAGAWGAGGMLVLDAAALYRRLRRVKQLLRARTFILLIPKVVFQELDELKRDQSGARDAIRWLETQLSSGSRYVRTQRPGQSRPLPLIKYPRKAPSHINNAIQIMEFCYHFVADEKQAPGADGDNSHGKTASLIVLITGNQPGEEEQYKEFSVSGAASAAGIAIQHIDDFYGKWRNSHRSGTKR